MQKKIIALAVAGLMSGAAFAQSNVTIYGNLDIGYLNQATDRKINNAAGVATTNTSTKASSTGFQDGALSTNHVGLRGTEDLGNGLKAIFNVEMGMAEADRLGADTGVDTANAYTFRKQNIGLQGGFGTITIGRQGVLIDEAWAVGSAGMKNNAFGDMYSSSTGGGNTTSLFGTFHDIRANEVVTYVSPDFSGFKASVQYGKGKTDTNGKALAADVDQNHTNWGFRLDYATGPMAVVFAYNNERHDDTTTSVAGDKTQGATDDFKKNSWILGANYDFKVVKVFGQYFRGTRKETDYGAAAAWDKETTKLRGWEFGVHVPVTAQLTLMGSYFDTNASWKWHDETAATAKSSGDGKGYQLAALYGLSKRTVAYAAYGYEKSEEDMSASLAKDSNKGKHFAVGLKHAF